MKNKILSFLLILLMLPVGVIFSACDGSGYDLKNLSEDFYSIAETEKDTIVNENNKLTFSYESFSSEQQINELINSNNVYSNLNTYNATFENLMSFSYSYVSVCSTDGVDVDKDVKNSLQSKMDSLHQAMQDVDNNVTMFAQIISTTPDAELTTSRVCLERFQNLLVTYELLFEKAASFNSELQSIYYNHVLTNSNPKVSDLQNSFDATVVLNTLDARIKSQVSNSTAVYVEKYVCGSDFAEEIISGTTFANKEHFISYKNSVSNKENKVINVQTCAELINKNAVSKSEFYNLSLQAYNAQEILKNENSKFLTACNKIEFTTLNKDTATNSELFSKQIIEDYSYLLLEYNEILNDMLKLI